MIRSISPVLACILLSACQETPDKPFITDGLNFEIAESRVTHFFQTDANFKLSAESAQKLSELLTSSKREGIDNIGFMLVSNQAVPTDVENAAKLDIVKRIKSHGFSMSSIIDSGTCVYDTADRGFRIDVLDYDVKLPNANWDYAIGDCDLEKDLPKKGAAIASNLSRMVANRHDLYEGREYSGPYTKVAISAVNKYTGGSSNSSSGSSDSSNSGNSSGSSNSSSSSSSSSSSK